MTETCPSCGQERKDRSQFCFACCHQWDEYDPTVATTYPATPTEPGFWANEITDEADTLLTLTASMEPCTGVEVGTHIAKTAAIVLYRRPDMRLHLVDTWQHSPERYAQAIQNLQSAGVRHRAHIMAVPSTHAAKITADASVDFVFIDASKHPPFYEADCRAWWPKVVDGGFLAGHDYHWPMVPPIAQRLTDEWRVKLNITRRGTAWWAVK